MFEFHQNRRHYFEIQTENASRYVLPFIEEKYSLKPGCRVLEIGCGEGGVLKAFVSRGCKGVGVEIDETRLINASVWLADDIGNKDIKFLSKDIYEVDIEKDLEGKFDIIVLKDVIEHIHDQARLINWMKLFLNKDGIVFFGFPPWQMPFGGHQQMCRGKFLSKLPYYHLLPSFIYKWILKVNKEPWEALLEIKKTGISIERFEKIATNAGYNILNKKHYLLNPIYQFKFSWKSKEQLKLIQAIPYIRNFFTTCVYYIIQIKDNDPHRF